MSPLSGFRKAFDKTKANILIEQEASQATQIKRQEAKDALKKAGDRLRDQFQSSMADVHKVLEAEGVKISYSTLQYDITTGGRVERNVLWVGYSLKDDKGEDPAYTRLRVLSMSKMDVEAHSHSCAVPFWMSSTDKAAKYLGGWLSAVKNETPAARYERLAR